MRYGSHKHRVLLALVALACFGEALAGGSWFFWPFAGLAGLQAALARPSSKPKLRESLIWVRVKRYLGFRE